MFSRVICVCVSLCVCVCEFEGCECKYDAISVHILPPSVSLVAPCFLFRFNCSVTKIVRQ